MPSPLHQDIDRIVYSETQIDARVRELGAQITADHASAVAAGQPLVLVCILRGSIMFMADLARAIDLPLEMDFMSVSSYGDEAKSSGNIRIRSDLSSRIKGCHVILVEDILDTGLTLASLRKELGARDPASIEIATLLRKDVSREIPVDCKYVGFECPDEFIVGYGLDYAQRYRNLPDICVLKPEIYT